MPDSETNTQHVQRRTRSPSSEARLQMRSTATAQQEFTRRRNQHHDMGFSMKCTCCCDNAREAVTA